MLRRVTAARARVRQGDDRRRRRRTDGGRPRGSGRLAAWIGGLQRLHVKATLLAVREADAASTVPQRGHAIVLPSAARGPLGDPAGGITPGPVADVGAPGALPGAASGTPIGPPIDGPECPPLDTGLGVPIEGPAIGATIGEADPPSGPPIEGPPMPIGGGIIGPPIPGAPMAGAPMAGAANAGAPNAGPPDGACASAVPQLRQNFMPGGFSPRQTGHIGQATRRPDGESAQLQERARFRSSGRTTTRLGFRGHTSNNASSPLSLNPGGVSRTTLGLGNGAGPVCKRTTRLAKTGRLRATQPRSSTR